MHPCMHVSEETCQPWLPSKFYQPRLCEIFSQIANHLGDGSVGKVLHKHCDMNSVLQPSRKSQSVDPLLRSNMKQTSEGLIGYLV